MESRDSLLITGLSIEENFPAQYPVLCPERLAKLTQHGHPPRDRIVTSTSCLLKELLGFVDFGGKVGTSSSIGMIQQHELPVILTYLLLRQSPLTIISQISPSSACRLFLKLP